MNRKRIMCTKFNNAPMLAKNFHMSQKNGNEYLTSFSLPAPALLTWLDGDMIGSEEDDDDDWIFFHAGYYYYHRHQFDNCLYDYF